jgi:hypothetical protein
MKKRISHLRPQNSNDEVRLFISLNYYHQSQQIACLGRVKSRITSLNIFRGEVSQPLQNESGQNIAKLTSEASLYDYQENETIPCYKCSPSAPQIHPINNPQNQLFAFQNLQPYVHNSSFPNVQPEPANVSQNPLSFQSITGQIGYH